MNVYCIFCKSGSEDQIAEKIALLCPTLEAIIPVRTLQEKRKGLWISTQQHLIPGYIFLYDNENANLQSIKQLLNVYRILDYETGARELTGVDFKYAMWLYRHCGNIQPSKVLIEGSRVIVVNGPLLDGMGIITKIDRHKRRAWVEFDFYGRKHIISLGIEEITSHIA